MNLDGYVSQVLTQLAAASAAGGEETREVAERLGTALDPALRLVLLEVLGDAASEITREIAPGSVDVHLRGRDPVLVTSPGPQRPAPEPVGSTATAPTAPAAPVEDGGTTRTTLRLPDHLEVRVEGAAAGDGVSVNTWLVRVVAAALEPDAPGRTPPRGRRPSGAGPGEPPRPPAPSPPLDAPGGHPCPSTTAQGPSRSTSTSPWASPRSSPPTATTSSSPSPRPWRAGRGTSPWPRPRTSGSTGSGCASASPGGSTCSAGATPSTSGSTSRAGRGWRSSPPAARSGPAATWATPASRPGTGTSRSTPSPT